MPSPYAGKCKAPQPWGSARCARPFEDYTGRRKFCSDACRASAHREKHRPAQRVSALQEKLARTRQQVLALELALARAIKTCELACVTRLEGER